MALNLMDSSGIWQTSWSPILNHLRLERKKAADEIINVRFFAIITYSKFLARLVRDKTCGWSCRFSRLCRKRGGTHRAAPGSQDLDYQTATIRMCGAPRFRGENVLDVWTGLSNEREGSIRIQLERIHEIRSDNSRTAT
jgi:hypothetical protein